MRVLILTGQRYGPASLCLPHLAAQPGVELASIVFSEGQRPSRWRKLRRDLKKVLRIGPLGALAGLRMRTWYALIGAEDLFAVAKRCGVPLQRTPLVNCDRTRALFREARAEIGLSLGNGYIPPSVFQIPALGMLNVHGEILPDFQGAASVIWSIYDGRTETGFTIHQIDERIDTGPIVYQERFPIAFRETLEQTVRATVAEINRRVPPALARVVGDFETYRSQTRAQAGGRSYTTPTYRQYRRMLSQHRSLSRTSASAEAGQGPVRP
ncbi:MAG: hypothetical protein HRF50_12025 [Phycisphaerae bacterium]